MTINQRVKILRETVNLSQTAFAEAIGTTRSNLAQIEQEKQLPTLTQIKAIVLNYNVTYDWLIDGAGPMQRLSMVAEKEEEYGGDYRYNNVVCRSSPDSTPTILDGLSDIAKELRTLRLEIKSLTQSKNEDES